MKPEDRGRDIGGGTTPKTGTLSSAATTSSDHPVGAGPAVGSAEHLQATFGYAALAADRAIGLWLARSLGPLSCADVDVTASAGERRAMSALVRASATAYVRTSLPNECLCTSKQRSASIRCRGSDPRS